MSLHDQWVSYILSTNTSVVLAVLAFVLAILYLVDVLLITNGSRKVIKEGLIVRIVNWSIFGTVFLLFAGVITLMDLVTWRATARLALLFLMLSEAAFQVTTMYPALKRKLWKNKT